MKAREIKDPPKSSESKIRTEEEAKKHKLIRQIKHCGMPVDVYEDKDTGLIDAEVFCYGCHKWVSSTA